MKPFCSLALLAALAWAAPAAAQEPPPAAPQVSQINGQLVPVGQHNEYIYSFRRWNVSTNPIGWMLGSYGVSASYAPAANFVLRADLNYFHPVKSQQQGYEIGFGVPIYFRRAYQGAFLEPGLIVRHTEQDYGSGVTGADTLFGPQVLFGWHWSWDSGLNVAAAVGVGRNWSTRTDEYGDSQDEVFANGYLRFGYEF